MSIDATTPDAAESRTIQDVPPAKVRASSDGAEMMAWVCIACVLTLVNRFLGYVISLPAFGTTGGHLLALLYLAGLLLALLHTARCAARLPQSTPFLLTTGVLLAVPMGIVLLLQRYHVFPPFWLSVTANNLFLPTAAALAGAGIGRVIKHPNTLLAGAGFAIFFDIIVVTMGTVAQLMKANSGLIAAVSVGAGSNVVNGPGMPSKLPEPLSGVTIGPADVLFLALFLSAVYQLRLSPRATFAWMFTLLLTALVIVELFGLPIPALAPMGVAVLIANARHAAFTPTEKRDLIIGAAFAVFCAVLIIFGSRLLIKPAPQRPTFGFSMGPIGPRSSLYVGKVLPGSSAEKANIRPGDEVVLIDGIPSKSITGTQYAAELEKGRKSGLKLRIRHQNEKNILDITLAPPGK
jgi:hypothetical protein